MKTLSYVILLKCSDGTIMEVICHGIEDMIACTNILESNEKFAVVKSQVIVPLWN